MKTLNPRRKELIILIILMTLFTITCKKDDNLKLPAVTKSEIFSLGSDAVTIRSIIKNEDRSDISAQGVCWSLIPMPTINDNTVEGSLNDSIMYCRFEGLTTGTKYYARVFVTSGDATDYGDDIEFTTINALTDIEENVYNTVSLGTQVWMVENLKTTRYNDGTEFQFVNENTNWTEIDKAAYCWYNYGFSNKNLYGALYNWPAVNSGQLCPIGWHVPSDTEWGTLTDYVGDVNNAGSFLKAVGTTWDSPNYGATDYAGFSALPGGASSPQLGTFGGKGVLGIWWSSTIDNFDTNNGYGWIIIWKMFNGNSNVDRNGFISRAGEVNFLSVRCIKD